MWYTRRVDRRALLLLALLVLAAGGLAAQSAASDDAPEPDPAEASAPERFHLETNVGLTASFFASSLVAEPNVVFRPRTLGVGLGTKLFVGATQFDVLVAPFGRLELGWFYLNGGYAFELVDAPGRYQMVEDGVLVALGITPELLRLPGGRFGVDLGLETHVKRSGLDGQLVAAFPFAASWSTGPLLSWLLLHAVATTSVRLGVLYTFAL